MFPFDVILFDVGGVLLTNGWDHCERAVVLDQFHLDRAEFEARHPEPYDHWERDAINAQAYLEATVFYQPRSFTPDEFLRAILAQSEPLKDGALGILGEIVASHKCRVGVLNNEAREPNDFRLRHFGIAAQMDVALSSCYLGLRKPEANLYRRALDILAKPAGRVLFIDDRPENVAGAVAAGMQAIRFEGAEALRRQLAQLEVL